MVVIVLGVGEVGKPLLEIIRDKHPDAMGIDLDPVEVKGSVEIMNVCYPWHDGFAKTTLDYISKYRPGLVIINSTIMPGTTREIAEQAGVPVAYSPVRGLHRRMKEDMLFYTKFIASPDKEALDKAGQFFEGLGLRTRSFDRFETVELMKPLNTTYYGLLIAWAQEVNRICREFGAKYEDVMEFAKEVNERGIPRPVMEPGFIGGHCVMPNIALLKKVLKSDFLDAIERSNEKRKQELDEDGRNTDK